MFKIMNKTSQAFGANYKNAMSDITLITPPDSINNDVYSIMLVYPQQEIRDAVSDLLSHTKAPVNIYLYDQQDDLEIDWMIDHVKKVNMIIIDLDFCTPVTKNIAGWIIAQSNTFYLTNDGITPYNKLSANRIYDLQYLEHYIKRGLDEI